MTDEIVIGQITPQVQTVGDDDLLLVWLKQPGVLRLIRSGDYKKRNDVTGVTVVGGIVQANGIQAAAGESLALLINKAGPGITLDPNGTITITPGTGGNNRIILGDANTIFTPEFLTKDAADAFYVPPFPVAMPNHGFANGNPARWNGSAWVKPGAPGVIPSGAPTPADDWQGIVRVVDANNLILYTTGKVTGLTGAGFTPGINYWSGSAWVTTKPTAFGSFEGKVLATSATEGILLPFKRRSGSFRPIQSSPTGVGSINCILRTTGDTLLLTTGAPARLYRSADNGESWTQVSPATWQSGGFTFDQANQMRLNGATVLIGMTVATGTTTARAWVQQANLDGSGIADWRPAFAGTNTVTGVRTLEFGAPSGGVSNWWMQPIGRTQFFTATASGAPIATISDANRNIVDSAVFGNRVFLLGAAATLHVISPYTSNANPYGVLATSTPFTGETAARCIISDGSRLYVGCNTKLFTSTDGNTWTAITPAIAPAVAAINDIINHPTWGVMAATDKGVIASMDNGASWILLRPGNATALGIGNSNRVVAVIDGAIYLLG